MTRSLQAGWNHRNALRVHDFVASRMEFEKLNIPSTAKQMRTHPQRKGLQKLWYPPFLPHAGSCGLAVKRSLHEAVGGYDESFFRVMDTDYCLRIQGLGTSLQFVSDALVHVRCREMAGASFRQVCLWGEYNTLIYKRHRPAGSMELWRWKNHFRSWVEILRDIKNAVTTRASGTILAVRVASRDLEGKHQAYGPTGTSSLMVRAIEKLSSYAT